MGTRVTAPQRPGTQRRAERIRRRPQGSYIGPLPPRLRLRPLPEAALETVRFGPAPVSRACLACWLRNWVLTTCITRSFYRNVVGVLLVYDVTNRKSFEHIQDWHQEVLSTQGPKVIFLLVGHKSDLQSTRCVSTQEAEALAASLGMDFIETSARNNCNVDLVFDTLTDAILQALQQGDIKLEEDCGGVRLIRRAQVPQSPSRKQQHPGPCQC
ncbi:ras-related protein Rab-42 [Fukomys damarensis]|uniref:ras-related protein Rab-42 n=1 Tax=Fukomys damarensis TaxID=885580 RepID=UPI0014554E06|nr:ras-related protein Rab-42 [Fukomys damarensis]